MTPYEIIILCSVGGILVGCFLIWSCERFCCHYSFRDNKKGEPLLNLEAGVVNSGSFSSSSSSGSETTSIFITKSSIPC